jgi:hypothetical protein
MSKQMATQKSQDGGANIAAGILQRKCTCGASPLAGGQCASCEKQKKGNVQRSAIVDTSVEAIPEIVHDVLRSSGEPLDSSTRALMESNFAQDFSGVRIHRDTKAAESASAINALAYTVGRDIAFQKNLYSPSTKEGKKLLAHELTHVVQQGNKNHSAGSTLKIGSANDAGERDADTAAQMIDAGEMVNVSSGVSAGALYRKAPKAGDDPIHQPMIDDFRREQGLPEGGQDGSGNQVGPTDAEIKYQITTPKEDPGKIRIDAVADFLASSLTASRNVGVHVNDTRVVALHWNLTNPEGRIIATSGTVAGQANATNKPFALEPAQFTGKGFVAGQYVLYCYGEDSTSRSFVYARRDFNVLSADLTTGTALGTTYGDLTFTKYEKNDANPPATPRYSVDVELRFLPKSSVVCDQMGFIQSMQTIDNEGRSQQNTVNPEQDARKTPLAWSIDRLAGKPTPFYGTEKAADKTISIPASKGSFGKGGASPEAAGLIDTPSWNRENNAKFESCVVCRSGANQGQVYGCATWGYTATAAGVVTMMPRSFRQMPSEQFEEAHIAWNVWNAKLAAGDKREEAPALKKP